MIKCSSLGQAADLFFEYFKSKNQTQIRLATPLGLGKPNQFLNLIYNRIKADRNYTLDIFTALSLDIPESKNELERRFLDPFIERLWGHDYPRLEYLKDVKENRLPAHINVHEFYVSAGTFKTNAYMQKHYQSINYTHVAQSLVDSSVETIVQLISKRDGRYSLSGNSDLTLDVHDLVKAKGQSLFLVGVVHPDLPFLGGDGLVEESFFDLIIESPEVSHKLFTIPREPLSEEEAVIGIHASQLVNDGGTLQIGIGSLSDSLVQALLLRHKDNVSYRNLVSSFAEPASLERHRLDLRPFDEGLYGTSEMAMDGFMYLRDSGVLKRTVTDDGKSIYLHAAFVLGSSVFYDWLRRLSGKDFVGFAMARVSKVNDLYDADENSLRLQRRKARFFNTCMQVTLLGAAASETLESGTVISGVGGQYNFVAMAHELKDALSILMLRSTSIRRGKVVSNIVWNHGNSTIPRHLRDIVITEYGIAFLRHKSDEDVIKALLNITDSQFQDELLKTAKKHLKIDPHYEIPAEARRNTKDSLKKRLTGHDFYKKFPFGSDFTPEELNLLRSLTRLKNQSHLARILYFLRGLLRSPKDYAQELRHMGFNRPLKGRARWLRILFLGSLER